MATGFQVAPLIGSTVVAGLTFTSANDDYSRDPISFELSGSNASIDGPYELIASGDIVDFSQETVWPRFTRTTTPIEFENTVAYKFYQIVLPSLRDGNDGNMQIAGGTDRHARPIGQAPDPHAVEGACTTECRPLVMTCVSLTRWRMGYCLAHGWRRLIASCFGLGWLPIAPGTWGRCRRWWCSWVLAHLDAWQRSSRQ